MIKRDILCCSSLLLNVVFTSLDLPQQRFLPARAQLSEMRAAAVVAGSQTDGMTETFRTPPTLRDSIFLAPASCCSI